MCHVLEALFCAEDVKAMSPRTLTVSLSQRDLVVATFDLAITAVCLTVLGTRACTIAYAGHG